MENAEEILNIALAFDKNYLTPFYVLLASVFFNNRGTRFHFHVIATGLSDVEKEEMTNYAQQNGAGLTFYTIAPAAQKGLVLPAGKHYTQAAYFRLFFPQFLPPGIKKLLYLDTDLVVNGNLKDLYTKDLGHFPVAAVPEVNATECRPDLGITQKGVYFNSGVMLINLQEWRQQQVSEKALRFIRDFPEKILFVDQDALNYVLNANYLPLEGKYNVIFQDVPANLSAARYRDFARDKIIIHYTLQHKPWDPLSRNRLRFLYFEYLKRSPKSGSKKYIGFQPTPQKIWRFLKLRAKETLCNYPFIGKRVKRLQFQ